MTCKHDIEWIKHLFNWQLWLVPGLLSLLALSLLQFNYLAFHTFVEFFTIIISFTMFALAWTTYDFSKNNFLIYLACGYFWVGSLDMVHTLTFKGLDILPGDNGHYTVKLWIGVRFFEALLLLTAPLAMLHTQNKVVLFSLFGLIATSLGAYVFSDYFPDMFIAGQGLTSAKIYSEYLIDLILVGALILIIRSHQHFSTEQRVLISASIIMTMCAELAFTFYIDLYGFSNLLGHIFKLFSFWFIFCAIIQSNLKKPYQEVQKLSRAIEQSPATIMITDPQGRIEYLNRKLEAASGYTSENTIGNLPNILESEDFSAKKHSALWKKITSMDKWQGEFQNKHRDGTPYWESLRISPIKAPNGDIINYLGVIEDITERKKHEKALSESEKLFRDFAESTSDHLWEQDENFKFTHIYSNKNKNKNDFFNYRINDIINHTRWEAPDTNPDNDSIWEQHQKDLLAHRSFRDFQYDILGPNGETHVLSISGKPFFDENGTFKGYRGTSRNITELIQNQQQNKRFMDALDHLPVGISLWDTRNRFVLANDTYHRVLQPATSYLTPGITYEEWLWVCAEHSASPEAEGRAEEWIAERLANFNTPEQVSEVLRDGRWQQLRFQKLPDGSSMQINIDIHDLKLSQEHLRQSQRLEAIGQLTGGIAHDFNNLLGVMIGNAEMLHPLAKNNEATHSYIESIIKAVDRGASLTQRLLAFSRQQTLSSRPTDINNLILNLQDMLTRTLGETIVLHTHLSPEIGNALVDPHQLESALLNLSINARDAMKKGGKLLIETSNITLDQTYANQHEEVVSGDYVSVTVSDNGSGMPPDVLKKAFEPFFTTKGIGEGSGLGLSMVYGFIKQSGGHITINSESGTGTTIKLYLPRSGKQAAELDAHDESPVFVPGQGRILVVEDDEDIREIPVNFLRQQGYDVIEVAEGKSALEHLEKGPPFDLLFTDVVLPGGMNGVEIALQAKQLQPGINVLFTSGYSESSIIDMPELADGASMIKKPYRLNDLLAKVQVVLSPRGDQ